MNIKDLISNTSKLQYKELCSALIERFAVKQAVKWDSVLPHEQQQTLFGGEILRLISDHPTLATQKEIRPICLMKGELSQLLFFYVQLKDEKLSKAVIERITRKFVGGAAADRYIIWFFGNKTADVLKIVISGKEGKKIRLKTLTLEAGQWFKTYDYILSEVERKFNTNGLFQDFKEPSGLWKSIWDAFDISIVNKKFYAEIKAIFDALTKEELPKCKGILTNDQDRVQFAIRLIGRIIFCWFLRRKGVIAADVLSYRAVGTYQNYYRDFLESLFFEVFNTPLKERRKDLPESIKGYPFLNGGLFEPQQQDHKGNWVLNISNGWFVHFFNDTLERYNFTVDENSAASSEIAIDPEMLGRIFENLLAEHNPETGESARKATGSYYTPREIVDFMVEESLIAYLKTNLSENPPPSPFSKGGAHNRRSFSVSPTLAKGGEGGFDSALEDFVHTGTLPDVLKPHSKGLLDRLNAIKVLDPACGSGAFPISMLQKLAGLKQQLDLKTTPYDLKLKTIENSIYGVDIQPMATELSRLRCWLSLIVDEDPKDIKPLPNLDFKFVTANSLIDLGYDEFILKVETGKTPALFLHDFKNKLDALKAVRQKYFEPSLYQREKDKLKKEFNTIKDDLFKMSLELIKQRLLDAEFANKITGWDPFDDSNPAPFFNKSWMFGLENGFDVVIANPPYGADIDRTLSVLRPIYAEVIQNYAEIYKMFFQAGIGMLNNAGTLTFITPNTYLSQPRYKDLRKFILRFKIDKIMNLGEGVFEECVVPVCLTFLQKKSPGNSYFLADVNEKSKFTGNLFDSRFLEIPLARVHLFKDLSLYFTSQLGNDQVYFDAALEIKDAGIQYHRSGIGLKNKGGNDLYDRLFSDGCEAFQNSRPVWYGKLINRYYMAENTDEYFNLYYRKVLRDKESVSFTVDAFEVTPRIIWRQTAACLQATVDEKRRWFRNTIQCAYLKPAYADRLNIKYVLAICNSKYIAFVYNRLVKESGRVFPQVKITHVKKLPLVIASADTQTKIVSYVDQILAAKQNDSTADTTALELEIDQMVYKLYGLTPEEIAIVEGKR